MCTIAKAYTGLEVRQLLFKNLDYIEAFDAVWACASLLHVPSNDLPHIFALIHRALKGRGLLYCSFKYGTFEGERNGRFFTEYPLALGTLDPAFALPAGAAAAQAALLVLGAALLGAGAGSRAKSEKFLRR